MSRLECIYCLKQRMLVIHDSLYFLRVEVLNKDSHAPARHLLSA
jgi:hypothetical protein